MKLLHEEMRDPKPDEDRRRSDARFERLMELSRRRFEFLQEQVAESRKRSDAPARGVLDIGRKVLRMLDETNAKLDQTNDHLDRANKKLDDHGEALKALRPPGNGNGGNGHHSP